METITRDNKFGTIYTFKVVDKVPADYMVWNVSEEFMDGYIAFYQPAHDAPHMINRDTLLAVKVDDINVRRLVGNATGLYSIDNVKHAKRWINSNNVERKTIAERVLPIYEAWTES